MIFRIELSRPSQTGVVDNFHLVATGLFMICNVVVFAIIRLDHRRLFSTKNHWSLDQMCRAEVDLFCVDGCWE